MVYERNAPNLVHQVNVTVKSVKSKFVFVCCIHCTIVAINYIFTSVNQILPNKMNRIFGRGKPKEPGPSITDCISNVSW